MKYHCRYCGSVCTSPDEICSSCGIKLVLVRRLLALVKALSDR